MQRLNSIDPASAAGERKELLDAVQEKIGMTPNILRTMANSPAALRGYLGFGEALAGGKFDAAAREAIALAVAGANDCGYCASAHAALSRSLKVDGDEIDRRLGGRAADPALDAVLVFVRAIVEKRGQVTDTDIAAVRAAGHDDEAIAEIVANVAANMYTNYFNHIAATVIDFPEVNPQPRQAA